MRELLDRRRQLEPQTDLMKKGLRHLASGHAALRVVEPQTDLMKKGLRPRKNSSRRYVLGTTD